MIRLLLFGKRPRFREVWSIPVRNTTVTVTHTYADVTRDTGRELTAPTLDGVLMLCGEFPYGSRDMTSAEADQV